MLRKIRRTNAAQDPNLRPSFFQSSSANNKPDERAKTIKKIDEIEAQMSQQWWKTKNGPGLDGPDDPNTDFSLSFPQNIDATPDAPASKKPVRKPVQRTPGSLDAARQLPGGHSDFASTTSEEVRMPAVRASQIGGLAGSYDGRDTGFTASKMQAVHVAEFVHDPQLEEAAIRFANGDDEGAEAALLEALGSEDAKVSGNQAIWLTLFDLYRATDQQERFENAALDFANRFGRSAPMWVSFPASARKHQQSQSGYQLSVTDTGTEIHPQWKSPQHMDGQAVAMLIALLEKSPQPWCLSWTGLASLDDSALEPLLKLLGRWADQSVKLRFFGSESLLELLKAGTVSGNNAVNPLWWRIRMEALRIFHRPDEFDVAALDYCVTYEVSPPSWEDALCNYKSMDAGSSQMSSPPTLLGESMHDGAPSSLPLGDFSETERTALGALGSHVSAVDLSGHIMGDAVEMLDTLNAQLEGTDVIVVVCSRLIRLDFLAAGALLNWVSARQSEGRQIQFKDLHRLAAVFFNVIGINEHAKLNVRND
jgi:anti-anti-sigma regulatory factor